MAVLYVRALEARDDVLAGKVRHHVAAKLDLARAEDCFCGMETDFPDYDDCGVSVDVDKCVGGGGH